MPNTAYYTMIYCLSLLNNTEYKEFKKNCILNRNIGKKKKIAILLFSKIVQPYKRLRKTQNGRQKHRVPGTSLQLLSEARLKQLL